MAQWQPYVWPVLNPWEAEEGAYDWPTLEYPTIDLSSVMFDIVLPELWKLDPEGMEDFGPGNDGDAEIDGEPDGNEPPVDLGDDFLGFPPTAPHQQKPPATWQVITARIAGQIDVQMMQSASTLQPGAILRGVTIPDECGTPYVGDTGTVWHLPDGTVIFIPAASTPSATATAYVTTLGSTGETEAADTAAWEIYNDATVDTGLDFICLSRMAYDHTGDSTLYGYYRTLRFTPRGQLLEISAETRVTIDVPEACP